MKNKKTIFLVAGAVFLAIIVIYSLKSPKSADNGVSAVGAQKVAGGADGGELSGESDEIVKILSALSKVDLKTDFFEDQFFLSLEDLSVSPAEGEMGRSNPFSAY